MMFCTHSAVVAFAVMALLAVLTAAHEDLRPTKSPTQRSTIATITVKTTADNRGVFTGFPASIQAGRYNINYINESININSFKIFGNSLDGYQATPPCRKCSNTITVKFTKYVDGKLTTTRDYVSRLAKGQVAIL